MHLQQQRIVQRRTLGPGVVQRGETVGIVGEHRRAAEDQRAFALQRGVDRRLRQDASRPAGRPRRGVRSRPATRPRPAAAAGGGPVLRRAGGPAIRARCSGGRASSASRTGRVRPARRPDRSARRASACVAATSRHAVLGQPVGAAGVHRGPLARVAAPRNARAAPRAPRCACAANGRPRQQRRQVCRAPGGPAARPHRRGRSAPGTDPHAAHR